MNPLEQLVSSFQDLVGQVPEFIQPVIVMLAGAIPFIEGEVASLIGVVGGLNPIVTGIAAAAGNYICVLLVVFLTSRTRTAVVNHRTAHTVADGEARGVPESAADAAHQEGTPAKPESKGHKRFKKWLVRFGVPGASLLGPLAIPTQFMSAMLVAGGTPRAWVLLWQAVAIVLWTTIATVSAWLALHLVVPV
ncbi:hypothetical protein ACFPOI_28400 [Nonomuraea angiospora]|uniref:Small multidrug efflux protein n=1 Tax=Nonomuraea angiospora TaxID=46172 RepID=A0ABR9LPF8_9ACTN|nr:small multidrug efflux protein [Nonomuraea angiospora]MBE1582190.1 hypothetical protein [Nonomuraea angiospora]